MSSSRGLKHLLRKLKKHDKKVNLTLIVGEPISNATILKVSESHVKVNIGTATHYIKLKDVVNLEY